MPQIEVDDASFARLQTFATPLVDTVQSAFNKVLELAERAQGLATESPPPPSPKPSSSPDLTHANLVAASVDGEPLAAGQNNWNGLLNTVIEKAALALPAGKDIGELIVVNHVAGKKEVNGYKYLSSAGVSVQGQNSNNAWKAIKHIAKATGIRVTATFCWADHPKAARPGNVGHVSI